MIGTYPNVDMALQVGRRMHSDFYVERMVDTWSESATISDEEGETRGGWWRMLKAFWCKLFGCVNKDG